MDYKKLLEFYYNIRLMKPETIEANKSDFIVNEERTYVPYEGIFGGVSNSGYTVYLGKIDINEMGGEVESEVEVQPSRVTYLCRFKTDRRGYYKNDSFYISPVVFALSKIIKESSSNADIDLNQINKINDEFNAFANSFGRKLESKELEEIFSYFINKFNLSERELTFSAVIRPIDYFRVDEDDSMLMELEDTLSLRTINPTLREYLEHEVKDLLKKPSKHLHKDVILKYTIPTKNVKGIWPSKFHHSLTEQVVINELSDNEQLLENSSITVINSLKNQEEINKVIIEMMVDSVIKRAEAISLFAYPDEAFEEINFNENKVYSSSFYRMDKSLSEHNLTVIDNRNDFFKDINKSVLSEFENKNKYKAEIADFFNKNNMPYIFEKFSNNNEVMKYIEETYKAENGIKLQIFEDGMDFEFEKEEFKKALEKVDTLLNETEKEFEITQGHEIMRGKLKDLQDIYKESFEKFQNSEKEKLAADKEYKKTKDDILELENEIQDKESELPFWKKLFKFLFKNDLELNEIKEDKKELEHLKNESVMRKDTLDEMEREFSKMKINSERAKDEVDFLKVKFDANQKSIKEYKEKYKKAFADEEMLRKLKPAYADNYSPVWISNELNEARAELFIQALKLHKAFVVNSRNAKTNLSLLALTIEGRLNEENIKLSFVDLIKTLSLVIPVIVLDKTFVPYILSFVETNSLNTAYIASIKEYERVDLLPILRRFKNLVSFKHGNFEDFSKVVPKVIKENIKQRIIPDVDENQLFISAEEVLNNMKNQNEDVIQP